jgi:TPP-dependent pyruvate/acetoin dehydrogenase alpha subunit
MAPDVDTRMQLLSTMVRIRHFEIAIQEDFRAGGVPGFVHLSLGQEATAAGCIHALRPDDFVWSTHRGHGHAIAKGISLRALAHEIYGRPDGINRGRSGSMHVSDPDRNHLGSNGIVGANLPMAVGAGWAIKVRGWSRVSVVFFGDGAVQQGAFHEALNLAAVLAVPVIFFCENNGYAELSPQSEQTLVTSVVDRASCYGIKAYAVDGNDCDAVYETSLVAVDESRRRSQPALIEASVSRWAGHYEGDPQHYRPAAELSDLRNNDPIELLRSRLMADGVNEVDMDALGRKAKEEVTQAILSARPTQVLGARS